MREDYSAVPILIVGTIVSVVIVLKEVDAFYEKNKKSCTNPQLHEVIAAVEKCNKQGSCSSDDKDKILREVCK